jgi:tetratricopeptide (TPR) repeat protein
MGIYLNATGKLAEARQVLTRALEIGPENEFARFYLGVNRLLAGDEKGASAVLGQAQTVFRRTLLALTEYSLGREKEAKQALEELIAKDGPSQPYRVAEVYAWRGDLDRAFEWLDAARAQNDQSLAYFSFDPLLSKLRKDPRNAALLERLALPATPP